MNFEFAKDLLAIREILGITQSELALQLKVQQITISRNELKETLASTKLMEKVYSYAFDKRINLGKLKEMMWNERIDIDHKLLFHGAKSSIEGAIDRKSTRLNSSHL